MVKLFEEIVCQTIDGDYLLEITLTHIPHKNKIEENYWNIHSPTSQYNKKIKSRRKR